MAKPRKASKRRAKTAATWQPVLTPNQLRMLARHAFDEAAVELNELRQHLDRYDMIGARSVVKRAHTAALSGVGLVGLACERETHEREAANA